MFQKILVAIGILWGFAAQAQNLPIRTVTGIPSQISETSGLELNSANRIWSHNDSGGQPELYEFDTTGTLLRTVTLDSVNNVDWEELAQDAQGNFYVGDFGNNGNSRQNLVIYKIPNPDSLSGNTVVPEKIEFSYPQQTAFPPASSDLNYDMEAMLHVGDSLYLFTKNRTSPFDGYTRLYRLPDQAGSYQAELLDSFYCGAGPKEFFWITAADISPDGKRVVLLSSDKIWLFYDFPGHQFLQGTSLQLGISFSQKEAICFYDTASVYISDELLNGVFGRNLYQADLISFLPTSLNAPVSPRPSMEIYPNPVSDDSVLKLGLPRSGKVKVMIRDLNGRRVGKIFQGRFPAGHATISFSQMSTETISSGIYLLELRYKGYRILRRFRK